MNLLLQDEQDYLRISKYITSNIDIITKALSSSLDSIRCSTAWFALEDDALSTTRHCTKEHCCAKTLSWGKGADISFKCKGEMLIYEDSPML